MRYGGGAGACIITNRVIEFVATGGYVGYMPVAPGTWGSAVGLLLFLILAVLPLPVYGLVLVGCIAVGLWTAEKTAHLYGRHDPPRVVIDEIAGMLVTYFSLPVAWLPVLTGFIFFRLFDIFKPIPQLERLPGGWGIMMDDLCAGVLAHASVRLVLWLV